MSSFTENLYLKRTIQKLQEENRELLKLINEVQSAPPTQPSTPPGGPNFPPELPPTVPPKMPEVPPLPPIKPRPTNTSVTQRSVSQDRPYDPNDDPNTTRPVKYGGGV